MSPDEGVALRVEHARPFVDVSFPASGRTAVAWLDTGGGRFFIGRSLGRDLGLVPRVEDIDGTEMAVVDLPEIRVGDSILRADVCVAQLAEADLIGDGFPAEAFVPASALAQHRVVLDYPGRRTVLDPASAPEGTEVPAASRPRPGWPVVSVELGGQPVDLLLDTGASCCMLSERLVERLGASVVSRVGGAFGLANMGFGAFEVGGCETVVVDGLSWAGIECPRLVAVTRPEGAFEGMMSSGTPIPVEGAIAGNVLASLRLDWHAAEQRAWVRQGAAIVGDVCQVPIVLEALPGALRIVGATDAGAAMAIEPGDELVAVDDAPIDPASFGAAIEALGGVEGSTRRLRVRRDGIELDVAAEVVRLV